MYKEVVMRGIEIEAILRLFQTQIDSSHFYFIKEGFTSSLPTHVNTLKKIEEVCGQVGRVVSEMEEHGFYLRGFPKVWDFVMVFDRVKVQNMGIFTRSREEGCEKESWMMWLRSKLFVNVN